jgi:hypothetical protein
MVTSALAWCGAPALADTTPAPSPTTTTTPDAPPPDPYKPPARTTATTTKATPRPVRTAPVVHSAPTAVHHYASAVHTTPRVTVQPTVRHARPAKPRRKRSVPARHRAPRRAAVHLGLAPVAQLAATAETQLQFYKTSDNNELLRLAGLAFAVLAAASLSFVFLSRRADPIARSS